MEQTFNARTVRVHTSVLAAAEKRLLVTIAERLPSWINSDHLTAAGALAMGGVGACFGAGGDWLALVIPLLAVNWFGDSLDGTLARVRRCERARYGYYVDHVLDAAGVGALVAGLVFGGHVTPVLGVSFLAAYYLLLSEIALATHARGTFRLSFWRIGPTELRIALAIGTLQLMRSETVTVAGRAILLFNAGCAIGAAGLVLTFIVSAVKNSLALFNEEPPALRSPTSDLLTYDRLMPILAAVDDFLFRSKIRATAKQLGVEIAFAADADEMLAKARDLNPSLLIFDLNSVKNDPIPTIAALKADPATAGIRTLGFVSHVDNVTIGAAKRAGADEILARGAFAGSLPEILTAGAAAPGPRK